VDVEMIRRRASPLALALALLASANLAAIQPGDAQARASETAVKAAYLFNFAQFVRWPDAAAGQPFTICVVGRDPFGATLDRTVAGETIDGRRIVVARISRDDSAARCQIAFLSSSEEGRAAAWIADLDGSPTLTVSDMPDFIRHGGMLQFVVIDNRVRFEINLSATDAVRLMPSSELSRVAAAVHRGAPAQ
jgi:hypothetical protein